MKVAFFSYSLVGGGAERNLINIANRLSKTDCQIDIIPFKNINDYKKENNNAILNLSIKPLLKESKKISLFLKPIRLVQLIIRVLHLVQKNHYDLFIGTVEFHPFYLAAFLAFFLRKKSVLIVGNNLKEELKKMNPVARLYHHMLVKTSFMLSSKIICVSEGIKQSMIKDFHISSIKLIRIYNGVNVSHIIHLSKKRGVISNTLPSNKNMIIYFGRLAEKKGIPHLIKAFSIVKQKKKNILLFIVGKGPMKKSLKLLAQKWGLSRDIVFYGFAQNPYRLLKNAKILVFPSYYEGFGNVIIEAWSCGIPVISTDCKYGPRELFSLNASYEQRLNKPRFSTLGALIPSFNPESANSTNYSEEEKQLARVIIRLLNKGMRLEDKKKLIGKAKKFSCVKMAKKHYVLFKSLLNSK